MLADCKIVAFVPTTDPNRSHRFYRDMLGLPLVSEDAFALVFDAGGTTVRVAIMEKFEPAPFTVLGWMVDNIVYMARGLAERGVSLERYPWLEQDGDGIWTAPSGARVGWFKDLEGNVLSIMQAPDA